MKRGGVRTYGFVPGGERCATTGKKSWTSRRDAKLVARRANPGERMNAYHCDDCGGWHLGHLPGMVRKGLATRDDLGHRGEG